MAMEKACIAKAPSVSEGNEQTLSQPKHAGSQLNVRGTNVTPIIAEIVREDASNKTQRFTASQQAVNFHL